MAEAARPGWVDLAEPLRKLDEITNLFESGGDSCSPGRVEPAYRQWEIERLDETQLFSNGGYHAQASMGAEQFPDGFEPIRDLGGGVAVLGCSGDGQARCGKHPGKDAVPSIAAGIEAG